MPNHAFHSYGTRGKPVAQPLGRQFKVGTQS